jgi:hypothetical protein
MSAPKTRTPEALVAARITYPDAVRATMTVPIAAPAKAYVGQIIRVGAQSVKILRCQVESIGAAYGACEDGDERSEMGFRLHLIVSARAARGGR